MTPKEIKARLESHYPDSRIEVLDLTGTEDHYQVYVESVQFKGMNRMQQHRAVMDIFNPELKSGEVHALTIKTSLPA